MDCPNCCSHNVGVVETRTMEGGRSITRRRRCKDCGCTFRTIEVLAWLMYVGDKGKKVERA